MKKYHFKEETMTVSRGNESIYCKVFLPETEKRPLPALILSHGYNSSCGDLTDAAMTAAEEGFYAVAYDFCGGSARSRSTGSTLDMSVSTEQEDLKAVIDAVLSGGIADKERIFLYGESQGGFVSAMTAADMPDKIAGLLLLYPALCIPDDWKRRTDEEVANPMNFMGMRISRAFRDGIPDYDIFEHMSKFERPAVIFHGDSDMLVNVSYSRKAQSSLKNSELFIYKDEGHGFSPKARSELMGQIRAFLEKNIKEVQE